MATNKFHTFLLFCAITIPAALVTCYNDDGNAGNSTVSVSNRSNNTSIATNAIPSSSLSPTATSSNTTTNSDTNSVPSSDSRLIHSSEDMTIKQIERDSLNNPLCKHTPIIKLTTSGTTGVAPFTVSFDASKSFDPEKGKIVSWKWFFDDGTTVTGKTAELTYTKPGKYPVTLILIDDQNQLNCDCAGGNSAALITVK